MVGAWTRISLLPLHRWRIVSTNRSHSFKFLIQSWLRIFRHCSVSQEHEVVKELESCCLPHLAYDWPGLFARLSIQSDLRVIGAKSPTILASVCGVKPGMKASSRHSRMYVRTNWHPIFGECCLADWKMATRCLYELFRYRSKSVVVCILYGSWVLLAALTPASISKYCSTTTTRHYQPIRGAHKQLLYQAIYCYEPRCL